MIKKYAYTTLAVVYILMLSGCAKEQNELAHNHSHNHTEHSHSHDHDHDHDHNDEDDETTETGHIDEIVLEPEVAQRFGVVTETIEPSTFNEIINVSGQILNSTGDQAVISAPTSGIIKLTNSIIPGSSVSAGSLIATVTASNISGGDANTAAKAQLEGAKRELDRITPLHTDGIVTTREYNAALQAYETAKAAYSSAAASGRVTSPISGVITSISVQSGEFVNVGQPIAVVSKNARLTLRADLPEKYYALLPSLNSANFRTVYMNTWMSTEDLKGNRTSDSQNPSTLQNGYIPVYFTFDNNGSITPGAFAEIRLQGNKRENVITVPSEALSEQQGQMFVYVKIDEHGYEKRAVKIGSDNGIRAEILSGVNPGEQIVAKGATIVKLAESSGNVPEGHSHNH